MLRWRRHLAVAAMGVLAALGWWLSESLRTPPVQQASPLALPHFFMNGMRARATDAQGRLQYRLNGDQLEHEPLSDVALITAPELTVYDAEGPPWTLRADSATVHQEGERIDLRGDVLASRDAWRAQPPMQLRSASMVLEPPHSLARTEDAVDFVAGDHRLRGRGLRARWDQRQLTVLQQVESIYVPR